MKKSKRTIFALILVILFCFSITPVYAADITVPEAMSVSSARSVILNESAYLPTGGHHVFNFTITTKATYTLTIVIDALGGDGSLVVLHKYGESENRYKEYLKDRHQQRYTLDPGNYVLEITAFDPLAYSASIHN